MFNKVKKFFKRNRVLSIGIILCLGIMSTYAYTKFMPKWFSETDTYNVVKEAFLTDNGYSEELSKHMSQETFKSINIYNIYNVNSPDYKKPFKVDFSLHENSRFKIPGIVYVQMTYSVEIYDSNNKTIGGSWNIPIKFTIKKIEGEWYITEKYEPA
ncbi:hypothetical protein psyc5s11_40510 [Clostridium gelidum]|uniref:DUF4829 domain-containing protein n=1 Tax=Clostridium gelidum TaxID=704125 RepID=A0ABN6J5P9_9CLOT|nr:hypothetical protein [Clostridium gelidum]BCZ47984.1 hypothetical protein psyc5s11_40510 [Clostridium gelidum]